MRHCLPLFLIVSFLCSEANLTAESEAEKRANARILQNMIDADNKRIDKEADKIYREKTGSGNTGGGGGSFVCLLIMIGLIYGAWSGSRKADD